MKKILLFFISIAIIFSFCSCAGSNNHSPDITDTQENCNGYGSTDRICESKDSFYLLRDSYIFVVDKKSHKCRPLCNKPDCPHDKYTGGYNTNYCNAFAMSDLDAIDYYGGKLYFTTTKDEKDKDGNIITYNMITRMNPDGTGREDIYTTTEKIFDDIKVHRGYVYSHIESLKQENSSWATNGIEESQLCRLPVNGGEWEKLDIKKPKGKFLISDYRIYGDTIYTLYSVKEKNIITTYNLKNNKAYDITDNFKPKPEWVFTVMNNKLYFDNGNTVYKSELDGTDCKKVVDLNEKYKDYNKFRVYNNDGNSVYITAFKGDDSPDSLLILLDKNGKTKSFKLPKNIVLKSAGDVDGQVFMKPEEDSDCFYYLDKTKLGTKAFMTKIYEQNLG